MGTIVKRGETNTLIPTAEIGLTPYGENNTLVSVKAEGTDG
jgi:hypothetical protein